MEPIPPLLDVNNYLQYEPNVLMEEMRLVSGATVVWADYEKIEKDYPFFSNYSRENKRQEIDSWLVYNCALISESQLKLGVNFRSSEKIDAEVKKNAYRPPGYGRAAIIQPQDHRTHELQSGILDLKGVGVAPDRVPENTFHQSGILHLPFAIQEITSQRIVERAFEKLGLDVCGVPVYALLDLGVSASVPGWEGPPLCKKMMPCSILVRQGHVRPPNNCELPDFGCERQQLFIILELLLRKFGISTCTSSTRLKFSRLDGQISCNYGGREISGKLGELDKFVSLNKIDIPSEFEAINIQATRDSSINPLRVRLVDFGHYLFREEFHKPILSIVKDRFLNWGGALSRTSERWVNPEPGLAIGVALKNKIVDDQDLIDWCGMNQNQMLYGTQRFGFELTKLMEKGSLNSNDVDKCIAKFVEDIFRQGS